MVYSPVVTTLGPGRKCEKHLGKIRREENDKKKKKSDPTDASAFAGSARTSTSYIRILLGGPEPYLLGSQGGVGGVDLLPTPGAPCLHALSPSGGRINASSVSWRQSHIFLQKLLTALPLSGLPYFICEKNCNYPQGVIGGKVYKLKRTGNGHLWLRRKHSQY